MLGHGNRFIGGHLHTIGNRCWCGYLAVPVRFHERDPKGKVAGKGEERYLAWLASDEKPDYVNPPVMAEVHRPLAGMGDDDCTQYVTKAATQPETVTKTCNTCNEPFTNRGKTCNKCRQAAYRERQAT